MPIQIPFLWKVCIAKFTNICHIGRISASECTKHVEKNGTIQKYFLKCFYTKVNGVYLTVYLDNSYVTIKPENEKRI